MTDENALISELYAELAKDPWEGRTAVRLRAWQPGDGLACRFASRGAKHRPCGRPVAVRLSLKAPGPGRRPQPWRQVVCSYHITAEYSAGALSSAAETAAREKVLADHWDDYQAAITEYLKPQIDAMVAGLPADLKAMIVDAISNETPS